MPTDGSLVVLDTSVVSLFLRNADEAGYCRSEIDGLRAVISFQTREEPSSELSAQDGVPRA